MKQKLAPISKTKFVLSGILTGLLCVVIIASCTKSSSSTTVNPFLGTWNGSTTCTGSATPTSGTVTLTGSTTTVNITGNCGNGTCYKSYSYPASVSGNSFSLATTTFQDNCGASYTISSNGSISGNTLTIVAYAASPTGSGTCTFTGTK